MPFFKITLLTCVLLSLKRFSNSVAERYLKKKSWFHTFIGTGCERLKSNYKKVKSKKKKKKKVINYYMVVIERKLEASQLQDRDYITVAYQLNFSENVRVVWFISMN